MDEFLLCNCFAIMYCNVWGGRKHNMRVSYIFIKKIQKCVYNNLKSWKTSFQDKTPWSGVNKHYPCCSFLLFVLWCLKHMRQAIRWKPADAHMKFAELRLALRSQNYTQALQILAIVHFNPSTLEFIHLGPPTSQHAQIDCWISKFFHFGAPNSVFFNLVVKVPEVSKLVPKILTSSFLSL